MIDGRGKSPGFRWCPFLAVALLLVAIFACLSPEASAAAQTPGTEAVSGGGQGTGETRAAASAAAGDSALDDPEPLPSTPAVRVADPIEPVNRAFFVFNDRLYFWLLKPAAQGYGFVVPEPARVGIRNAFANVTMPIRFVNSLLQGKVRGAGRELARFAINTTIGLGGLFDTAKDEWGIAPSEKDTGLTLGAYGLGHGAYLVLPFLGPSSIRDGVGLVGDAFLDPLSVYPEFWVAVGIRAGKAVNETSLRIGDYEDMKAAAIDPYLAVRDGYIQYRKGQAAK